MNARTGSQTVGTRLAGIASRFPGRTALVERASRVSFEQLDAAANAIAQHIPAADCVHPGRVCLFFESKVRAIESIFKVKVVTVRTQNMHGKVKRLGRSVGRRPDWKRAIVTLAKDQTIELFDQV